MQSIFSPNNGKKVIRLKRDVVFFHGYILNKCQLSIFIQTRRHCKFTKYTLRFFLRFFSTIFLIVLFAEQSEQALNTEHRAEHGLRTRNTDSVHGTMCNSLHRHLFNCDKENICSLWAWTVNGYYCEQW